MLLNRKILITFIIVLINISATFFCIGLESDITPLSRISPPIIRNDLKLKKHLATKNYFSDSIDRYKELKRNLKNLSIAEKELDIDKISISLSSIQHIYASLGNYKKAIEYNAKFKKYGMKYKVKNMIFNYYLNLSTIYYIQFNDELSLVNAFRALKYSSDETDTWHVYDSIGAIYTDIKDFKDSLFYARAAEAIVNRSSSNGMKYYIQYVIANIYLHQKKYKKSIETISTAFAKLKSPIGYEYNLHYISLAYAYFNLKKYDKALFYFNKNLNVSSSSTQVIKALSYIGRIHVKKHEYVQAYKYLKKAEKINNTTTKNNYNFMLINKGFYELFAAEKKYDKAYRYLLLYSIAKNKHYDHLLSTSSAVLKNEYVKTQVPILKEKLLSKARTLHKYNIFSLFLIIISSLILIMCFLFFYLYFTKKAYAKSLKELNSNLENEIKTAAEIQLSILPNLSDKFKRPEFTLYAELAPAKDAAGDFYDFFYLDDDRLALIVADVSGKGITAAIFMSFAKTILRNICPGEKNPADALNKANRILASNNVKCMFVTVFLCFYNIKTGIITYSNAGHHEAIILAENSKNNLGDMQKLTNRFHDKSFKSTYNSFGNLNNLPLGVMINSKYDTDQKKLELGESIICYTDGVTEGISPLEEEYGEKRLCKLIDEHRSSSPFKLTKKIIKNVIEFEGKNRFDDITVMIFKRNK
jgi:serine phosphatase RsbU (regulator of sigma subunit)